MRYYLILLIFCFFFKKADAQLIFQIDEVWLSYYNIIFDSDVIDEDLGKGPYVYVQCLIINNSDTVIILNPSKSNIKIAFRYNKSDYEFEVYSLSFKDNKELILSPKDSINFSFGSYLLLGTDIFNYKEGNYTKQMLSILPTLKVRYKDDKIEMKTSGIKNVVIKQ